MEGIHTVSKFFLLRHSNLSPKGFLSSSLRHGEAVLAKKKVFLKHLNMLSWQKTGKPATSEINQTQKAFEQQCWQGSLFGSWSLPKQRSLPQQTLQGSWATEPPCSTAVQANLSWWHDFWSRTFTSFKGQETLNLQRIFFSYTSCIVLQPRFIFFPSSFETSLHTPSNQQKQRQQTIISHWSSANLTITWVAYLIQTPSWFSSGLSFFRPWGVLLLPTCNDGEVRDGPAAQNWWFCIAAKWNEHALCTSLTYSTSSGCSRALEFQGLGNAKTEFQ